MAKHKKDSTIADLALRARRVDRAIRAEHDPYFGKRRPAGQHAGITKASASREACRKGGW